MNISAEEIVGALYRTLLSREPDAGGLRSWSHALAAGHVDLEKFVKSILSCEEFGNGLAEFNRRHVSTELRRFTNDVSQFGEIQILIREMVNRTAAHRIVVDVGANGRARSNSYDLLYHFGWRGILIEANPRLLQSIRNEFQGLDYYLVNRAVSDYSGVASFYIGINNDVSSLNRDSTQSWGEVSEHFDVKVDRLADILEPFHIPRDFDLLSIDAEGEDLKILNDVMGSGFYPRWIILEAAQDGRIKSLGQLDVREAVRSAYIVVGVTRANLILRATSY
jgi:FkbM family methyltransferase